jgi:sulfatase maturation enzyme AslB (radical SAM superfamily)
MFKLEELTTLDIETINNCNAKCPLCLRGSGMQTNDHLDWDRIVKNIPDSVWGTIKKINFNGSTGDNLMHPHIFDIINWVITRSPACLQINTNGSIRDTEWWFSFGALLKNHQHRVVFGIDGLEDTHSKYRINTQWTKIINNAQAFIDGGGTAEWQFILFDHNKHQIAECRRLSENMGFTKFFILYQDRFDSTGADGDIKRYNQGSLDTIPIDFHLKDPAAHTETKYVDDLVIRKTAEYLPSRTKSKGKVACKSQKIKWLSIYADGTVWPCCWLMGWHLAKHQQMFGIVNYHFKKFLNIDFNQINLYNNNLEDIITSDLWTQKYPTSFRSQPNPVCIQSCST